MIFRVHIIFSKLVKSHFRGEIPPTQIAGFFFAYCRESQAIKSRTTTSTQITQCISLSCYCLSRQFILMIASRLNSVKTKLILLYSVLSRMRTRARACVRVYRFVCIQRPIVILACVICAHMCFIAGYVNHTHTKCTTIGTTMHENWFSTSEIIPGQRI